MISVETIVDAPPAVCREIFSTFSKLNQWHTSGWITSVESTTPGKTEGTELVEGDTMRSKISGMTFNQTVLANTPAEFRWIGPWYGLLTGTHGFQWHPIPDQPHRTRMVQWESFTGILAFSMDSPSSMGGKKTLRAFEAVNADLKKAAEAEWQSTQMPAGRG